MFMSISGVVIYMFFGQISLIYDSMRGVAIIAVVPIDYEDELSVWMNWRELLDGEELEYNETIEFWLLEDSVFPRIGYVSWRSLYRDNEKLRIVYFSYTETPIAMIRRVYSSVEMRTQSRIVRTNAFQYMGPSPQKIEVYYLHNLHRLQRRIARLSDEDFDVLRENATLLWQGTFNIPIE